MLLALVELSTNELQNIRWSSKCAAVSRKLFYDLISVGRKPSRTPFLH